MKQLAFFLITLLAFTSCNQRTGSGNIITETRQTADFTGVSVGGAFTMEIKNGPITQVQVEADDNIIGLIETNVSGNVLKIRTRNGSSFSNAHFKVYVTAPEINSIHASGASDITSTSQLKSANKIFIELSGAANIKAAIDAPQVYSSVSGAGTIELSGRTKNYMAKISGSGRIKSAELMSENTDVHVSGAGSAKVHASVNLKANISGAGTVGYSGGAAVQQHISGAGTLNNEN